LCVSNFPGEISRCSICVSIIAGEITSVKHALLYASLDTMGLVRCPPHAVVKLTHNIPMILIVLTIIAFLARSCGFDHDLASEMIVECRNSLGCFR
jgi:ABC-type amino acid transport system permease subunit